MSRPDQLAKVMLDRGKLLVDLETGAITRSTGKRAEIVDKRMAYGRVAVCAKPMTWAMAHRVVWIAAHGLIPDGLQINHRNRLRWDNRLTNLELVDPRGNMRHWMGFGYDAIGEAGNIPPAWTASLDAGDNDPDEIDPYGRQHHTITDRKSHGAHIRFF